jgi:hypothetical protein
MAVCGDTGAEATTAGAESLVLASANYGKHEAGAHIRQPRELRPAMGACRPTTWIFHPTFHFPRDTTGRHATPRDTLWLMLLNFPNGVMRSADIAKLEVVSSNLISRSGTYYTKPV